MKFEQNIDELLNSQPYSTGESLPRSPYEASDEEKHKYHFHKLAYVSLQNHTLICTFTPDPDPSSIFYTPLERGAAPVRFFDLKNFDGDDVEEMDRSIEEKDVEIMPDALSVRVGDHYISSEAIFGAVSV